MIPLPSLDPTSTPSVSASGAPGIDRQALREAAEGFEAIMIRKLLESARASSFAEDAPLTGGGLSEFKQMRDEQFADMAAKTGAFGFARSIESQLSQQLSGQKG